MTVEHIKHAVFWLVIGSLTLVLWTGDGFWPAFWFLLGAGLGRCIYAWW